MSAVILLFGLVCLIGGAAGGLVAGRRGAEPEWRAKSRFRWVAVDLDGTLCRVPGGGLGYADAKPYRARIRALNRMRRTQGLYVTIYTARGNVTGDDWTERTKAQLREWGLEYDALSVGVKPGADIFVDDRAVRPEEFFR